MNDREKSPGAPDAQIPPPRHPKFEHLPKRFFSPMVIGGLVCLSAVFYGRAEIVKLPLFIGVEF